MSATLRLIGGSHNGSFATVESNLNFFKITRMRRTTDVALSAEPELEPKEVPADFEIYIPKNIDGQMYLVLDSLTEIEARKSGLLPAPKIRSGT